MIEFIYICPANKINMGNKTITCPVSGKKINESVARIAALITIGITLAGVILKSPVILIALGLDFALRAFTNGNYSPIKYTSKQLFKLSWLSEKIGDAAPKKFAAGIGFVFALAIAALQLSHFYLAANLAAAALLFCASLEAFAAYCLGCVIYTYTVLPFLKKEEF